MQSESTSLFFKEGTSDKEYHLQLEPKEAGWIVNFQYGRCGSALRSDTKTSAPLPYAEAKKIYDRLLREKTGKGYRPVGIPKPSPVSADATRRTGLVCELLTPIELGDVATYILNPAYWMQDKRDGHRRMVEKCEDGTIVGVNRRGITVPLPAPLHAELRSLALQQFILDGEIEGERLVVFDLLNADGDMRQLPYSERFARLLRELSQASRSLPSVLPVPTWRSREEKEAGLAELYARKAEGVVFKSANARYAPGRSGSHFKFKFTATCSARVRTINGKRSVELELQDEAGAWQSVGNVSVSVSHEIPSAGSFVEVRYLYATAGRRLYQPVYLGVREDISETDCVLSQLKFKRLEED